MIRAVFAGFLLFTATIHAQEPGAAAAESTNMTRNTNWEKWFFIGSSFAFAAAGVVVLFANGINGSSTFDPFTHN